MLTEIKLIGRGGQGVVSGAEILGQAAILEGFHSTAIPRFGAERRGAPVFASCRVSDKEIRLNTLCYSPSYVLVIDPTVYRYIDIFQGLTNNGSIVLNTMKSPEDLGLSPGNIWTVDANGIAIRIFGKAITNTVMLGAFCRISDLISIDSIEKAIVMQFPPEIAEKNVSAVREAYKTVEKA